MTMGGWFEHYVPALRLPHAENLSLGGKSEGGELLTAHFVNPRTVDRAPRRPLL